MRFICLFAYLPFRAVFQPLQDFYWRKNISSSIFGLRHPLNTLIL